MENRGLLIVIEGTDCSGKETQSKKLADRLTKNGEVVMRDTFPRYDSPTGKIIGGPYLGKSSICEGWFPEKAPNVDALVSCFYYAADRRYHKEEIENHLKNGEIVIIDRYVESNMAHQGSKLKTKEERLKLFQKLNLLEYEIAEMPRPDAVIFLYMPYEVGDVLRKRRIKTEALDQHEADAEHLKNAEKTYLELAELYSFHTICCANENEPRTIDDIHEEVFAKVQEIIRLNKDNKGRILEMPGVKK